MIWEFGIDFPLCPFFAMAETARRAIDDAVSKPETMNLQSETDSFTLHKGKRLVGSPSPNSTPTGYIYTC